MAQLQKTPYFKPISWDLPAGEYTKESEKNQAVFDKLCEKAAEAARQGKVIGRIVSFPVADGAAYYLVKKEKPFTLQWINVGDCWQVHAYTIRGLRVADIL